MPKYVALLRGIAPTNPNMRNEKLRGVFEDLGFKNVSTVISSGNVIFDPPSGGGSRSVKALEKKIETALPKKLGFESTTIIRSKGELEKLTKKNPFKNKTHSQKTYLTVTFLKSAPRVKLKYPYRPEGRDYSLLAMHNRAIFSIIDIANAKTPDLMVWLEKTFGKQITTRTWKTVHRILKKMEAY